MCIASSLVRLGRALSNKHTLDFINHSTSIAPKELKVIGKVGWDSTIPILTPSCDSDSGMGMPAIASKHPNNPDTSFFECPNCKSVEPSSCKHFQLKDLDIKHKCHNCAKYNAVRFWRCPCGSRWQHCQVHRYSVAPENNPHMSTVQGQSQSEAASSKRKRKNSPTPNLSYDDLLAKEILESDHRLGKKYRYSAETLICLGKQTHTSIKPNLIGPSLRARFMGGST